MQKRPVEHIELDYCCVAEIVWVGWLAPQQLEMDEVVD